MPLKKVSKDALKEKKVNIENKLIPLQERMDETDVSIANLQNRKSDVQKDIDKVNKDITDIQGDIASG